MKRLLLLLAVPLLLVGCETVNKQDRAVLRAHNVPDEVFDKMLYGDPLSVDDVIALSRRAVPTGLIIHYMDETDSVYRLPKEAVRRMRAAGVSEEVVSYMLSTAPPYVYRGTAYSNPPPYGPYPYGYGGYGYDPYYDAGYYGGPIVVVGGYHRWGGWGHRGGWHGGRGDGGHHH